MSSGRNKPWFYQEGVTDKGQDGGRRKPKTRKTSENELVPVRALPAPNEEPTGLVGGHSDKKTEDKNQKSEKMASPKRRADHQKKER